MYGIHDAVADTGTAMVADADIATVGVVTGPVRSQGA
jgi:hypothetical protein